MTHEELLAKLKPTYLPFPTYSPNSVVNALVAVVELHKPMAVYKELCRCETIYPCPTIQAIEKELG